MTIRITPHVPSSSIISRLSGKLEVHPATDNASQTRKWKVAIDPKIKIAFFEVGAGVGIEGSKDDTGVKPSDLPLDRQIDSARKQLVEVATKKSYWGFGKTPIVAVTLEKLHSPDILGPLNEIFDANMSLDRTNQIFFLVSGTIDFHRQWWEQLKATDAIMTKFTDIYLPHAWSLDSFCEQVIDRAKADNPKLISKFAKYLVVLSRGELREVWRNLDKAAHNGVDELTIERYARFYKLLLEDDPLSFNVSGNLSLKYPPEEITDRIRWCTCFAIQWFVTQWQTEKTTLKNDELIQVREAFATKLPTEANRKQLMDLILERLADKGYIEKVKGIYRLPRIQCPRCGSRDHKASSQFCSKCGAPLPKEPILNKIECPQCGKPNRTGSRFCSHCGISLVAAMPTGQLQPETLISSGETLSPGTVLQRYRIIRQLGHGGMGSTYLVEDTNLFGRRAALKEMLNAGFTPVEQLEFAEAFRREAELLASLTHPNIVRITDFFSQNRREYLVMDYVEGQTLEQMQNIQRTFSVDQVVKWGLVLCDVLSYLHTRQPPIIFRDMKPANVMITPEGQLVLIDFGIARLFKVGKPRDTGTLGTPGYAAPEQYGTGQTDARSDIYSLGVTLYQLISGYDIRTIPFQLPPLRSLNPSTPEGVAGVIDKATKLAPQQRFQTAQQMRQALEQCL